jgi:serine-type D-Ala-D-Ala carboxypeptidase/endopeptidase
VGRAARRGRRSLVAGVFIGGVHAYFAFGPRGEVPDSQSLFEIGSITKVLTGTLLADMHLRGEVGLDDPVSEHLPADRLPRWRDRIPTLRELATHRAGLPNTPPSLARREMAFAAGLIRQDPWSRIGEREYAHLIRRVRPRSVGRAVRYSSVGFGLLGEALGHRADKRYDDLIRDRVCLPLGMSETRVKVAPGETRLLPGYSRTGRPRPPLEDLMPAAGSLRSDAEDMLRFLDAALAPPLDTPGPALRMAMETQATKGRAKLGLGWVVLERPRRPTLVWHNGGTWGYRSFAGLMPGRRTAVVVLSNTSRSVDRLGFDLLDEVKEAGANKG